MVSSVQACAVASSPVVDPVEAPVAPPIVSAASAGEIEVYPVSDPVVPGLPVR